MWRLSQTNNACRFGPTNDECQPFGRTNQAKRDRFSSIRLFARYSATPQRRIDRQGKSQQISLVSMPFMLSVQHSHGANECRRRSHCHCERLLGSTKIESGAWVLESDSRLRGVLLTII